MDRAGIGGSHARTAPPAAVAGSSIDRAWAAVLALLLGIPMAWSATSAVQAGLDPAAWLAMATAPQTWQALALSLWTCVAASVLSIAASAWILSRSFPYR